MQHSPRLKTVGTWVLGSTVYSYPVSPATSVPLYPPKTPVSPSTSLQSYPSQTPISPATSVPSYPTARILPPAISVQSYPPQTPVSPGHYKHWTQGPEDRGPKDRGPEDQGPEDPSIEGSFALQQLSIAKIQLYSQSLPMLQGQTHSYVLFIITEGITFNKQRYFKLSSEFFDAQSSCEIAQSSTKSVFCVYSNADCTMTQPCKFFRILTQVDCNYNTVNSGV